MVVVPQKPRRNVLIAAVLATAVSARASAGDCLAKIHETASRVAARSYPSLRQKEIGVETFKSDFDFFQARPRRAWGSLEKRRYVVRVNVAVCADPPSDSAVEAVLAHELAHLDSYTRMSRLQLIGLGWRYLTDRDGAFVRDYERATDAAAAKAGYAAGLIAYREWVLKNLSPENARRKARMYLDADEIQQAAR
jgi:hypothetical protein